MTASSSLSFCLRAAIVVAGLSTLALTFFLHRERALAKRRTEEMALFPYEAKSTLQLVDGDQRLRNDLNFLNKLLVTDYEAWHRRTRAAFEKRHRRYISTAKPSRRPQPPRTIVVRSDESLSHGLGDRFRGIISAYLMAVLSRRLLLIDWQSPIPLHSAFALGLKTNFSYDPQLVSLPPRDGDAAVITGSFIFQMEHVLKNVTTLYLDSVPRPALHLLFKAPTRKQQSNQVLRALSKLHRSPLEPCHIMPLLFRVLFKPTDKLRSYFIQKLSDPPLSALRDTAYYSIHSRLGYGLGELRKDASRFDLGRQGLNLSTMAQCMARISHGQKKSHAVREGNSPAFFFLATDTPAFRTLLARELERQDPSATLTTTGEQIKHVRTLDKENDEDVDLFFHSFLDILVLSRGGGIVHLRSGFADLAVWMGAMCEQRVVTSEECVHGQERNT